MRKKPHFRFNKTRKQNEHVEYGYSHQVPHLGTKHIETVTDPENNNRSFDVYVYQYAEEDVWDSYHNLQYYRFIFVKVASFEQRIDAERYKYIGRA